jgi:surface antigen
MKQLHIYPDNISIYLFTEYAYVHVALPCDITDQN